MEDRGAHLVIRSPHAPDFWWGNFLLLAGVPTDRGSEQCLEAFAAEFPAARHVAIGVRRHERHCWQPALVHRPRVQRRGPGGDDRIGPPSPRAARGEDAPCRELGSDDDWTQSVDLRLRCAAATEPSGHSRELDTQRAPTNRRIVEAGHGQWFGAFVDGVLVAQLGIVNAGGGYARFQSVETDPRFRRRGLARALIQRAARYALAERALTRW